METQDKNQITIGLKTTNYISKHPHLVREKGSFCNADRYTKDSVETLKPENLADRLIKYINVLVPEHYGRSINPKEAIFRKSAFLGNKSRSLRITFMGRDIAVNLKVEGLIEVEDSKLNQIFDKVKKESNTEFEWLEYEPTVEYH